MLRKQKSGSGWSKREMLGRRDEDQDAGHVFDDGMHSMTVQVLQRAFAEGWVPDVPVRQPPPLWQDSVENRVLLAELELVDKTPILDTSRPGKTALTRAWPAAPF